MVFGDIFTQIFQPYFYYSVLFLVISFVCIKILARFCPFMGQRTKSLLYLIPLVVPLLVMLAFFPSTVIQTTTMQVKTGTMAISEQSPIPLVISPTQESVLVTALHVTSISVTGILCIIGLVAGVFFALSMILADDRIARKTLHVISLSPEEYPWLQAIITESSKKLAITLPKIGLVEDLRPNAFTIGYGRRTTLVFSIGLFDLLNKEEIAAVALHELAHVKNHDFFYKIVSSALTVISFFNPLAYLTALTAQREREMFADERAIALLDKPSSLSNALAKICNAIQSFPKESFLMRSSTNLLVTSSVLHRPGILATHPTLDKRLRNISASKSKSHLNLRTAFLTLALSLLLVFSAFVASFGLVDLQSEFTTAKSQVPYGFVVTDKGCILGAGVAPVSNRTISFSAQNAPADVGYSVAYNYPAEPQNGGHLVVAPPEYLVGVIANSSNTAYRFASP